MLYVYIQKKIFSEIIISEIFNIIIYTKKISIPK